MIAPRYLRSPRAVARKRGASPNTTVRHIIASRCELHSVPNGKEAATAPSAEIGMRYDG